MPFEQILHQLPVLILHYYSHYNFHNKQASLNLRGVQQNDQWLESTASACSSKQYHVRQNGSQRAILFALSEDINMYAGRVYLG
jgi:hypothetical protein